MQTFLPYSDFARTAAVLDRQRLGKQRVEALQILRTLTGLSSGWRQHPAVKMWAGYEQALAAYALAVIREWVGRGYRDTCADKVTDIARPLAGGLVLPPWLGSEAFHSSHRAALLAKNSAWYGQFSWSEQPKIDYIWPESCLQNTP